jgi:hypothetical protein
LAAFGLGLLPLQDSLGDLSSDDSAASRGLCGLGDRRWLRSVLSSLRVISRLVTPCACCRDGSAVAGGELEAAPRLR